MRYYSGPLYDDEYPTAVAKPTRKKQPNEDWNNFNEGFGLILQIAVIPFGLIAILTSWWVLVAIYFTMVVVWMVSSIGEVFSGDSPNIAKAIMKKYKALPEPTRIQLGDWDKKKIAALTDEQRSVLESQLDGIKAELDERERLAVIPSYTIMHENVSGVYENLRDSNREMKQLDS